jgi:hypothetical protein
MDAVPIGHPVFWRGHWMKRTGVGATWEVIRPGGDSPFIRAQMPIVRAQMQARGMGQEGDVSGGGFQIGGSGDTGGTSAGGAVDTSGDGGAGGAAATGTSTAGGGGGGGGAPAPAPAAAPPTTTPTNWTPWIIGGASAVAVGAIGYALYHRGRRRRRR